MGGNKSIREKRERVGKKRAKTREEMSAARGEQTIAPAIAYRGRRGLERISSERERRRAVLLCPQPRGAGDKRCASGVGRASAGGSRESRAAG